MNCKNCGEKIPEKQGERLPSQVLRNMALFPSERLTVQAAQVSDAAQTFTGTQSVLIGAAAPLASYPITADVFKPKRLYNLPHLPLNVYFFIKDFTLIYAGTAAAAHQFSIYAYYQDLTGMLHVVGAGTIQAAIGQVQTVIISNPSIVIPGSLLNVSIPDNVGRIVLYGMSILGADSGVFYSTFNGGLLYATPEDN